MAYNLEIEDRIGEITGNWPDLAMKKMSGGVCYLLRGKMAFSRWKDFLIVRTGNQAAERFLQDQGTRPFDVTGRAMKGWVMIDGSRWEEPEELEKWLTIGRDFVLTLPVK